MTKKQRSLAGRTRRAVDKAGDVRGKYVGRFAKGSSVVVLDPDVARVFTDSESVNQALRALGGVIQHHSERTHP